MTPVLSLEEARRHPHMVERQSLIEVAGVEHPAVAPRLSRTPGGIRHPPARRGEHTREALMDWGFGADEVETGRCGGFYGVR